MRPRAELWNALGGGIAVTLNSYIHAQSSDDSDSDSPGGPRRVKKGGADGTTDKKLEHKACVSVAVWSKDGCSLVTGDSHGEIPGPFFLNNALWPLFVKVFIHE